MGGRLERRSRAIPGWVDPLGLKHPQGTQGVPVPVQGEARVGKVVVVQGQGYPKVPLRSPWQALALRKCRGGGGRLSCGKDVNAPWGLPDTAEGDS